MPISQGQVYFYDFGPRNDPRIEGPHYAVVVQSNSLNRLPGYGLAIVVPVSSTGKSAAVHVKLEPDHNNGLEHTSYAKCEQVYTVPSSELIDKRGALDASDLFRIKEALRIAFAL